MTPPSIWQIGSGDAGRRYDKLFLDHDVMLCGPGRFGPFDEKLYRTNVDKQNCTKDEFDRVRRFRTEVRPGDFVLLRAGHKVTSIGVVTDDPYAWDERFSDVFGWDIEHCYRVRWDTAVAQPLAQLQSTAPLFGARKMVPTFTRVDDATILNPIQHLLGTGTTRPINVLPAMPSPILTIEQLEQALFGKGLSYDAVGRVRQAVERHRRLLSWYWTPGIAPGRPTEHEIVAHVILPLMLALGWSEQLLAIEWRKVDLAVFWTTPTTAERCKLVCEAKSIGHGLQDTLDQAIDYTDRLGLSECNKILLADGGRFYLYRRHDNQWNREPEGYFNIMALREQHVFPKNTNAVETLMDLTPARINH